MYLYRSNLFLAEPKASGQHIKRKLVSFVDHCHCLTQSAFFGCLFVLFVFFLFVYLFVHFFAPVCIVQAYACLLVVSSVLTGRRQKSILILYFSKMKKKSVKNYRTVFVMSKQFSLPKINLILQKLKKGP